VRKIKSENEQKAHPGNLRGLRKFGLVGKMVRSNQKNSSSTDGHCGRRQDLSSVRRVQFTQAHRVGQGGASRAGLYKIPEIRVEKEKPMMRAVSIGDERGPKR